MGQEAIKLELIEWLSKLEDADTIKYLKIVKESRSSNTDWWDDLTDSQKQSIERGLRDIQEGKTTPHNDIKKKYGL
tara:strand:- start:2277 stop:2504 length:228 start_codon:yes stop_codon:yes gene_type:complete